ncbi:alpha/beta fold hydrolase [Halalkalibaculum sp. DA3122]|uniref:alpha/beta fold hydrolase n=1 Tax=Halalkalibaculum sp. DA3122 TaxID=3373607 RepID=UPI00375442EE
MFGKTKFEVRQAEGYRYIDLADSKKEGRTLVLLHGMFGGLSNFDPLLNRVQHRSVFVPEIPVYSLEKARLTIPELANWLSQVLKEHAVKQPILLGNSMGGHIALQYALTHPDEVEALVLTGSSGLFENDLGSSRPKRYDREYVKERASLTFYEDLVDDTIIDEILEILQSPSKLGRLLRVARSTHEHNLEDKLNQVQQPVLLIWGKNDVITPPEVAELFCEKLPNATLAWIDRCGHAPMMEHPDKFAARLINFLETNQCSRNNEEQHEEDYSHH